MPEQFPRRVVRALQPRELQRGEIEVRLQTLTQRRGQIAHLREGLRALRVKPFRHLLAAVRLLVAERAWVKIGDPVVELSSGSGPVTSPLFAANKAGSALP